jgi:hypothetical protein
MCVLRIDRAVAGRNAGWVDSGTLLINNGRIVEADAVVTTDGCSRFSECPSRKDFTPRLLGGVVASAVAAEDPSVDGNTVTFDEPLWIQIPEAMEIELFVDCGAFGQTERFGIKRHYPFAVHEDAMEGKEVNAYAQEATVETITTPLPRTQHLHGSTNSNTVGRQSPFFYQTHSYSLYRRRLAEEATTTSTGPKKVCVRSSHLVLYGLVVVIASFGSFWLLAPCFKTQRADDGPDGDYDDYDDDSDSDDEGKGGRSRAAVKHGAGMEAELGEGAQYGASNENMQMQQQQMQQQQQQQQYAEQQQQYAEQAQQYEMQMQQQQQYELQMQQQQQQQAIQQQQQQGGQPFVEHSL